MDFNVAKFQHLKRFGAMVEFFDSKYFWFPCGLIHDTNGSFYFGLGASLRYNTSMSLMDVERLG